MTHDFWRPGVALGLLMAALMGWPASAQVSDRVVAMVNGEIVTLGQTRYAAWGTAGERAVRSARDARELAAALDELIDEIVLAQAAREAGVTLDAESLDRAVASILDDIRRQFPSEAEFRASLATSGATVDTLRAVIRRREERRSLGRVFVNRGVEVTPAEVAAFEAERQAAGQETTFYALALILVAVEGGQSATAEQDAAARRRAVDIAARIQRGEDFDELARKASDDRASAARGGSMGWVERRHLRPELLKEVETLEVGEVSAPLRCPEGYQIARLAGVRDAEGTLLRQKHETERARLTARLREKAQIDFYPAPAETAPTTATVAMDGGQ